MVPDTTGVRAAEVVLPCAQLDPTVGFLVRLGFRLEVISPADDPAIAQLSGHGLRVRLDRTAAGPPGMLRLLCDGPIDTAELTAPNGTRVLFAPADPPLAVPDLSPELVISRAADGTGFHEGRAAMGYRDLIPSRLGGRFIASHIRIAEAGPVPDYVHFHKVRFQMIYCLAGWARLVYEDQGPPFVLAAGDCVLQPPEIRHRVLESSAGLEVLEIGCPAIHDTYAEHDLELPNATYRPERVFGGQRFVRHEAATAVWEPWRVPGFACRDSGIGAATGGLAAVRTVRPTASPDPARRKPDATRVHHDGEFVFLLVACGAVTLDADGHGTARLGRADSAVIPSGVDHRLLEPSADLEIVEVTLPAVVGNSRT